MKRVWLIALGSLALPVVLVGVGVGLLGDAGVTTKLGRDVLGRFKAQLPAGVTFSSLAIDVFHGGVRLENLVVTPPGKPNEHIATARKVVARLELAGLLKRQVRITALDVEGAEVKIVHLPGDRYNFQDLLPKPNGQQPSKGP